MPLARTVWKILYKNIDATINFTLKNGEVAGDSDQTKYSLTKYLHRRYGKLTTRDLQ